MAGKTNLVIGVFLTYTPHISTRKYITKLLTERWCGSNYLVVLITIFDVRVLYLLAYHSPNGCEEFGACRCRRDCLGTVQTRPGGACRAPFPRAYRWPTTGEDGKTSRFRSEADEVQWFS